MMDFLVFSCVNLVDGENVYQNVFSMENIMNNNNKIIMNES